MASHYSDIGFQAKSQEETKQLALHAATSGSTYTTSLGDYIAWQPGEGSEIWVQISGDNHIVGLHPHYAGTSRMLCCVNQVICDPKYPLDGSIAGWACVTPEQPHSGAYPLTAKIPDFIRHFHEIALPTVVMLQVTAFAQQVMYFSDDDAFDTYEKTHPHRPLFNLVRPETLVRRRPSGIGWFDKILSYFDEIKNRLDNSTKIIVQGKYLQPAAESYTPIGGPNGVFTDIRPDIKPDAESVLMSGHITASQLHTNPETGHQFYALLLRVQEGTFDVVADIALFRDTQPVPGGILCGTFWLSAQVIDEQDEQ